MSSAKQNESPTKEAINRIATPEGMPSISRGLSVYAPDMVQSMRTQLFDDFEDVLTNGQGVQLLRAHSEELNDAPEAPSPALPEDGEDATEGHLIFLRNMPQWTFVFPNLSQYPYAIREFVRKDLFQADHIHALDKGPNRVINWDNKELTRLIPLKTEGDGNCLLHAVSLGMWGIHDRKLILRRALHVTLNGNQQSDFCNRWKIVTRQQNAPESKWTNGWNSIVQHSGTTPQNNPYKVKLEFLEQLHIFVLANILRRPIIVYGDDTVYGPSGEVFYRPTGADAMTGIYLPLEWPAEECNKNPLGITFSSSHFAALIGEAKEALHIDNKSAEKKGEKKAEKDQKDQKDQKDEKGGESENNSKQDDEKHEIVTLFPIVNRDRSPLGVHFLSPAEEQKANAILNAYLDVHTTPGGITVARQCARVRPDYFQRVFEGYLKASETKVAAAEARRKAAAEARARRPPAAKWNCPICTYSNAGARTVCEMCGSRRPAQQQPAPQQQPQQQAKWSCPGCTFLNVAAATRCAICGTSR